jgi:hypothetical protein
VCMCVCVCVCRERERAGARAVHDAGVYGLCFSLSAAASRPLLLPLVLLILGAAASTQV